METKKIIQRLTREGQRKERGKRRAQETREIQIVRVYLLLCYLTTFSLPQNM
jgi:hypothetical protein